MGEDIGAFGGAAVANTDDITDWDGARGLVATATHTGAIAKIEAALASGGAPAS